MSGSQTNEGAFRHSHPLIREIDEGLDQLDPVFESFVRQYSQLAKTIVGATRAYIDEVRSGQFPQRPSQK